MQAFVHFAVGVCIGLLVLPLVDLPSNQKFLLIFASGFWALIPDGHWIFKEFDIMLDVQSSWRAVHQTDYVNIFWFHHFIDRIETGRNKLETGVMFCALFVMVLYYYRFNNWESS